MVLAQKLRDVRRLKKITEVLYKHELGHIIEKLGLRQNLTFNKRLQNDKFLQGDKLVHKKLKDVMQELSGTFARFGQFSSRRIDILPKEYSDEFSKLKDIAMPIHYIFIKRIIEREFKKPLSDVFQSFEKIPIFSSSLSQVHKAVLKSGEEVIVKIQKPDISSIIETDIEVLYHLASLFEEYYKELNIKATDLVEDFGYYLRKELNYSNEARLIENLNSLFKEDRTIKIPRVYPEYSTSKVLTAEYVKGRKLLETKTIKSIDKKVLSKNIADAFFSQVIYHNFFHKKPNEDNIIVLEENKFGLLKPSLYSSLNAELAEKTENIIIALVITDRDLLLKSLLDVSKASNDTNLDEFKEELLFYFGEHYDEKFNINFQSFADNTFSTAKRHNINLSKDFVSLMASMIILEESIKKIDNDFNLTESLKSKAQEIMKTREDSARSVSSIRKTLLDLKEAIKNLSSELNKVTKHGKTGAEHHDIEKISSNLDKSSKTITLGLITVSLIISGTLMILVKLPPVYYSISALGSLFILAAIITLIFLIISGR